MYFMVSLPRVMPGRMLRQNRDGRKPAISTGVRKPRDLLGWDVDDGPHPLVCGILGDGGPQLAAHHADDPPAEAAAFCGRLLVHADPVVLDDQFQLSLRGAAA